MDGYPMGTCSINWYCRAFYVGFKTIRPTTDYGKQEKYGVVSSTPAVPLHLCFMPLILLKKVIGTGEEKKENSLSSYCMAVCFPGATSGSDRMGTH